MRGDALRRWRSMRTGRGTLCGLGLSYGYAVRAFLTLMISVVHLSSTYNDAGPGTAAGAGAARTCVLTNSALDRRGLMRRRRMRRSRRARARGTSVDRASRSRPRRASDLHVGPPSAQCSTTTRMVHPHGPARAPRPQRPTPLWSALLTGRLGTDPWFMPCVVQTKALLSRPAKISGTFF